MRLSFSLCLLLVSAAAAQQPSSSSTGGLNATKGAVAVTLTVTDETNRPIEGAIITVTQNGAAVFRGATNYRGQAQFRAPAGVHELRIEKPDFYAHVVPNLDLRKTVELAVTLHHVQEFKERVEVTDSAPEVDLAQTASAAQLTNRELFSLPYPTTRDFRQALPFIPGVLLDQNDQIHVAGAAGYELYHELDGFDITQPVTGLLDMRLSPDALRLLNVQDSRYSAEYGKGSGGVLQMDTDTGDDRFRFKATNFTPGLSFKNGLTFENVTPRFVFSGPIKKNKAWWFQDIDGEYDTNLDTSLPSGANTHPLWRADTLSKVNVNLTQSNILSTSFLFNHEKDERVGLSQFTPVQSTTDQHHDEWLADVKDSAYFSDQMLVETGIGVSEFHTDVRPRGSLPSLLNPNGAAGSAFERSDQRARRVQGLANIFLPPVQWHGRHEFKVGTDLDAIKYDQSFLRHPILIVRSDGTLARSATFFGRHLFNRDNFEASAYGQDRWSLNDRVLLEYGARGDWDEILRDVVLSPRFASTFLLDRASLTKLSFGAGLAYDRTNLDLITRPLQGLRVDQNFGANGVTPIGLPIVTSFAANPAALEPPRFLNTSVALERMLPKEVYLRVEALQKRGRHGFDYVNLSPSPAAEGQYALETANNDRYDSISVSAHKKFAVNHEIFGNYTHALARSNAVLDFSLQNPLFAQQAGGPLAWDSPNRLISWGWFPMPWQLDLAYSVDWRTGFPFNVVNSDQQLVGAPGHLRFPDFFSLDLHLEKQFHFEGRQFAIRLGVNNVTDRKNPAIVNNNIDSPEFLAFAAFEKRAFTARIRFLGRGK